MFSVIRILKILVSGALVISSERKTLQHSQVINRFNPRYCELLVRLQEVKPQFMLS